MNMSLHAQQDVVILGLGLTGLSCARFLTEKKIPFFLMDNRTHPPQLSNYLNNFPKDRLKLGCFDVTRLTRAKEIILSPGMPKTLPILQPYITKVISDIELFQRYVTQPIVGITGSNGKSTVTALLAKMSQIAGNKAVWGANFGMPALDLLLNHPNAAFYILELSSFQLEITQELNTKTAVVLNIMPDHMDRYSTFELYANAKRKIYQHCTSPVINLDEVWIWKSLSLSNTISYSIHNAQANFYVRKYNHDCYIMHGEQRLLALSSLKIYGMHNAQNALAALALGHAMGLSMKSMLDGLKTFEGLPHRCQWVRTLNEVRWYNDSKATNIMSTIAALKTLGQLSRQKNIVLILGGQGKNADFALLNTPIHHYVKALVFMGEDAEKIGRCITAEAIPMYYVHSLERAVLHSFNIATVGDIVLLSPACGSFDQFKNFEDRGNQFINYVLQLS